LTLKVRYRPFETHTRSLTLETPTHDAELISRAGEALAAKLDHSRAVRLLGIRAEMSPPLD